MASFTKIKVDSGLQRLERSVRLALKSRGAAQPAQFYSLKISVLQHSYYLSLDDSFDVRQSILLVYVHQKFLIM
jgi:hypothetical protein